MDKIKCEHPLTYHDFFERFNATSHGYHACPAYRMWVGVGAAIVAEEDSVLVAILYDDSYTWNFEGSAFDGGELDLMAQLAATSPEFRGGIDND
ncbi:hypothetical protein EFM17_04095 [Lactobacillus delbrueckii]|nr:hypothetical protein [Lactobacillus delbrueckii]